MKTKKSLIISRILLITLFLAVVPLSEPRPDIFAQGIYSRHVESSENGKENVENNTGSKGGIYRAGGTEGGGQASKISPVNDAWSILVMAGIGYGLCLARRKKNNRQSE
jgi:hypothetical protein